MPEGNGAGLAIPVSPGELIDRITILELKARRLPAADARERAAAQLRGLQESLSQVSAPGELDAVRSMLRDVNAALWDAEDRVRRCEAAGDFGLRFIQTARSIYRLNDRRSELKRRIDSLLESPITEDKSYGRPADSDPSQT